MNVVALASRPELEGTSYNGTWVVGCSKEELLQCFEGWEPEVMVMLEVRA